MLPRLPHYVPILLIAAGSVAASSLAEARECGDAARLSTCINADTLWPRAGAARFQSIGSAETTAPGQVGFGLVTTYLRKPIVLQAASASSDGTEMPGVDHLVNTTFLWSYGLTDRLELGFALPTTLYQNGSGITGVTSSTATPLPRTAIRDMRFGLAWAVLPRARAWPSEGLAVTARFDMAAPTGEKRSFASEPSAVWMPSVAAEWRRGGVFAGAELGARLRGTASLGGTRLGSQLVIAAGFGVEILPAERLSAALEMFALPTFAQQQDGARDPATNETVWKDSTRKLVPAEWMATVRSAPVPGGDFSLSASGGTGLPLTDPSSLTTPDYRFVLGVRYAPLARDTDGDGVMDRDDACPTQREDRDGFQDEDGCVDADNDRDGIPDEVDRCRDKPEDADGFKDEDGCPDLDDDGDGIPDAEDQCRNKAEDKDGFEDSDGCPDPDDDGDGIPDAQDKCPRAAEDMDGFNDADGCPDPDNDIDGIPDAQDKCPLSREDKDNFQDDDGCPDLDNDADGIPDDMDKCPLQAETIDGRDDLDGCPEPGAKDLTSIQGSRVTVAGPVGFAPGQAKLAPAMRTQVAMIAQRVRGMVPVDRVIIEAYADKPGDNPANEKLASDRAEALRQVFLTAGFPVTLITAAAGDLTQKRAPGSPQYEITVQRGKYK